MNSMNGNRDTETMIPDFNVSGLNGPARVGMELRGVRERLGWKLPDIATRLKIRLPFLEAIEAGDLAALPAPAYAAGFIRSYAETMGLDPEEILRRFRAEGMTRPKQPTLSFPEPVPDRAVPPGAIVFLVAVIGIGAYFLWYRHSEHELKMAQMVPAVPAKLAPLAVPKPVAPPPQPKTTPPAADSGTAVASSTGGAVPAAGVTTVTSGSSTTSTTPSAPTTTSATGSGTTTVPVAAGGAMANVSSPGASNVPASAVPGAAGIAAAAGSTADGSRSSTTAAAIPANGLVISASADSWVQVQAPSGVILFSRVLKAGSSWPVPDEPGLTLTTGNAGGTELVHNGVAGAPLGAPGAVLRKVPLTPAAPGTGATATVPAAVTQASPTGTENSVTTPSSGGSSASSASVTTSAPSSSQ